MNLIRTEVCNERKLGKIQLFIHLHACTVCGVGPVCYFFSLCCMRSSNPLLKMGTTQYSSFHCSQVTLLPLSPMLLSLHLTYSPSISHYPSLSAGSASFFFFSAVPPPPPSAFDDLSQAHAGEYSKGGYGGSAQSQAKSAGSGPGKGTYTTHVHNVIPHTVNGRFLCCGKIDLLTIADDSTVKSVLDIGVYLHVCDCTPMCTLIQTARG